MQSRKSLRLVLVFLGTAGLLSSGCAPKTEEVAAAPAASSERSAPVAGTSLQAADSGFTVSGPLIVEQQLDVVAQRDGVIAEVRADTGTRVHTGDSLAQLDDRQLVADLEAARAKTRSTEADLKAWQAEEKVLESDYIRAEKMGKANIITQEQLEHAKFKVEADQFDVQRVQQLLINAQETQRSLELELDKTRVRAPFAGVVARRYVRLGQQVAKGDRLFWVTAEGPLRMRFTVPEKFIGVLKLGQRLALTAPDFPGKEYQTKVVELGPVVDPASGTIDGMVELVGAPASLRPGMSVILAINTHP